MFFEDALTASKELEITLTREILWAGGESAHVRDSLSCGGRISDQTGQQGL